jgi:molecular chaperone GrpE
LIKRDDLLQENKLDEQNDDGSTPAGKGVEVREGVPETSQPAKNIADSHESGRGSEKDVKESHHDEGNRSPSKSERHSKGAKKTSKKELLELIKRKNEMLKRMGDEIDEQRQELKNKEDKLLRVAAEFENYKKRTRREWELLEQKAKAELITDILGVLDDFDRALEALGEREDHVADGVKLIVSSLKDVLVRVGVEEVEAFESRFDPQYHEAVGEVESDEIEEGSVAHVVQKGYKLMDILLRPAKVIVAKKK